MRTSTDVSTEDKTDTAEMDHGNSSKCRKNHNENNNNL